MLIWVLKNVIIPAIGGAIIALVTFGIGMSISYVLGV